MAEGAKAQTKVPDSVAKPLGDREIAPAIDQSPRTLTGRILDLQKSIGNQRVQKLLSGPTATASRLLGIHVGGPAIQRDDYSEESSGGDRLSVQTESVSPTGEVQHWAGPRVISAEGDRVPYNVQADVRRDHRPYGVTVGVRRIASGEVVVERAFRRLQLLHWRQAGHLRIPAHSSPSGPSEAMQFFVRLEPSGADPVEYTATLSHDEDAVELARVLHGEGGGSLQGMAAIAHVVQNRLDEGRPASQVDSSSPAPRNLIATAYLLRGSASVAIPASWQRSPATASREFAQAIIRSGGAVGTDPTDGALFYCTAGTEERLESRPGAFQRLGRQVQQGLLRRIRVGGNTFYGRGPEVGSAPPDTQLACRRP